MACKYLFKKTFKCRLPGTKVYDCQGIDCPYGKWVIKDPLAKVNQAKELKRKNQMAA